jgi:inorganic pyrophosphatase
MPASSPSKIPPRAGRGGLVNVIIDTPGGSRNKYKFDADLGVFRISRILPVGMSFPYDFGSVPGTRAEDGDPLDVLVLGPAPTFPGCLVTVRLIGILRAQQVERGRQIRNDRLIGVLVTPVNRAPLRELGELDAEQLRGIEEFFISYNRAHGRAFRITGRLGARAAEAALDRAVRAFAKESAG